MTFYFLDTQKQIILTIYGEKMPREYTENCWLLIFYVRKNHFSNFGTNFICAGGISPIYKYLIYFFVRFF